MSELPRIENCNISDKQRRNGLLCRGMFCEKCATVRANNMTEVKLTRRNFSNQLQNLINKNKDNLDLLGGLLALEYSLRSSIEDLASKRPSTLKDDPYNDGYLTSLSDLNGELGL